MYPVSMTTNQAFIKGQLSLKGEINVRVIATFAEQHMKAAATFRDQVIALETLNSNQEFGPFFEDIRSYGSACIMSAAASLEALINELFINPAGPLRTMFSDFESDFWGYGKIERKAPLEKYQIALDMLDCPRFDERTLPYRDAWALFELRNALVHYKPTWDPDRQQTVLLKEVLAGKYDLSPFPDDGSDFVTMRSMSAGCMRWVIVTVTEFLKEFCARSQLDEHKISAFWKFET